jgi:hypothetical protein
VSRVSEILAAAIGVPATFLLGWWGRGKWERYPWNAKPLLYAPAVTSAEALREWEEPYRRRYEAVRPSKAEIEEFSRRIQEAIAASLEGDE